MKKVSVMGKIGVDRVGLHETRQPIRARFEEIVNMSVTRQIVHETHQCCVRWIHALNISFAALRTKGNCYWISLYDKDAIIKDRQRDDKGDQRVNEEADSKLRSIKLLERIPCKGSGDCKWN